MELWWPNVFFSMKKNIEVVGAFFWFWESRMRFTDVGKCIGHFIRCWIIKDSGISTGGAFNENAVFFTTVSWMRNCDERVRSFQWQECIEVFGADCWYWESQMRYSDVFKCIGNSRVVKLSRIRKFQLGERSTSDLITLLSIVKKMTDFLWCIPNAWMWTFLS